MGNSVIVTGGLGYIGTAVCEALSSSGFAPIIIDNRSTTPRSASRFPIIVGDYGDKNILDQTLGFSPIGSIHLANSAYVGESMDFPTKYFSNNVAKTAFFLEWCELNNIKKTVFSSSCATYGAPDCDLISEDTPQIPINPYGESKLMIERMLTWLDKLSGHRSVSLRYFNVAGNSQISDAKDEHENEPHLVPRLIKAAKSGSTFIVNGAEFATRDGSAERDFIHVDDLARAHVSALNHLAEGGESLKLNLGTGKGATVLEVLGEVEKRFGKIRHEFGAARPGDPAKLVASPDLATQKLNWRPEFTGVESILKTIID